ncbi:putative glycosyl hydrolase [Actinoplanes missouriensis 431]|uniref:Putative glycosyl hydrolase n=1 Tax=Actinoplanes missouriensis (strain ATCC 14538 / DSM 43046 / CBS 188.64 / JCM 3121 / NBRC 102363 / NCIMB 12654 / NRRL B-3342 / UNCC 431) TaxID=512565 RepID=I0H0F1_ACTM4|nr:putative glycosyl hydrolase [Actinoplanes missouriensis 431]
MSASPSATAGASPSVSAGLASSAPASATAPAPASASAGDDEGPVVAPYVDILGTGTDIEEVHEKTGLTDFSLAFVLADAAGTCTPTWGGTTALDDSAVAGEIEAIDGIGGEVIVSTGGATGTYLENVCSSGDLADAYADALDAAGSNHLDVDIEQDVDHRTVAAALAELQAGRGTAISLTLPVGGTETGLTDADVELLRTLADAGVELTVNAMTMNFSYDSGWGEAMTEATEAVHADLATVWPGRTEAQLYAMLGVTPMIGVNDTGPVTTVANARTVLAFAAAKGLGFVRFWSVNRDNGDCGDGELSGTCSGISQSDYAFTKLFAGFE